MAENGLLSNSMASARAEMILNGISSNIYKTYTGLISTVSEDSKNILHEILANKAWKAIVASTANSG